MWLFLAGVALTPPIVAQRSEAAPASPCFVDEAAKDASLAEFRNSLRSIVRARDWPALRRVTAVDVYVSKDVYGLVALEQRFSSDVRTMYWTELAMLSHSLESFRRVDRSVRRISCAQCRSHGGPNMLWSSRDGSRPGSRQRPPAN